MSTLHLGKEKKHDGLCGRSILPRHMIPSILPRHMKKQGFPEELDKVGKEMCYHSCIFYISEWEPEGWVDSHTKGCKAGTPTCYTIIRYGGGYTYHMHYANGIVN